MDADLEFWVLNRLKPAIANRTLPHAILIEAVDLVLGTRNVEALVRQILSGDAADTACHQTNSPIFMQVASGAHPDFDLLEPEARKGTRAAPVINIEQVRTCTGRFRLTPTASSGKILFIRPAEALNNNAVTALLKTMEEPPPGAVLILLCANRFNLLETVRSRCILLRMPSVGGTVALPDEAWLTLYRRTLESLCRSEDRKAMAMVVTDLAAFMKDQGSDDCFGLLQGLLKRTVDVGSVGLSNAYFDSEETLLTAYGERVGLDRIPELWDKLATRKGQLDGLYLDHAAVLFGLIDAMGQSRDSRTHI